MREKQINSLFSRWSKLKQEGKLKLPTDDTASKNEEMQNEDDQENEEEQAKDNNDHNFKNNPFELRICCPGRRMIGLLLSTKWYPGMVKEVGDFITVKNMEVPAFGKNCFKWPKSVDVFPYEPCDIIWKIASPKPISSRFFGLAEDDFKDVWTISTMNEYGYMTMRCLHGIF